MIHEPPSLCLVCLIIWVGGMLRPTYNQRCSFDHRVKASILSRPMQPSCLRPLDRRLHLFRKCIVQLPWAWDGSDALSVHKRKDDWDISPDRQCCIAFPCDKMNVTISLLRNFWCEGEACLHQKASAPLSRHSLLSLDNRPYREMCLATSNWVNKGWKLNFVICLEIINAAQFNIFEILEKHYVKLILDSTFIGATAHPESEVKAERYVPHHSRRVLCCPGILIIFHPNAVEYRPTFNQEINTYYPYKMSTLFPCYLNS